MTAGAESSIPIEVLPERLWTILAPEAPTNRKMLVARAALPLPPEQLVAALTFLTDDPDQNVRNTARKTLRELPEGSTIPVLSSAKTAPAVLDRLAHVFWETSAYVQRIVLNRSTPDATFLHLAKHGTGQVLEMVGQNQDRIAKCPNIVEALYFNPNTKMSTVSRVLEFAVREELPIQSMPGYKEIVASVMGEVRGSTPSQGGEAARRTTAEPAPKPVEADAPLPSPQPAKPAPWQASDLDPADESSWESADEADDWDDEPDEDEGLFAELLDATKSEEEDEWGFEGEGTSPGGDDADEAFFAVLAAAMSGEGDEVEEEQRAGQSWADRVRDMAIPDRIRLALIGAGAARAALVKDSNKLVATAVLRNPGLTDKEIVVMAKSKSVSQDVILIIASSREWSRNYQVQAGLVNNPKTPPHLAMRYLKSLMPKDLKAVSKSRDVPNSVARQAKRMLDLRFKKK